MQSKKPNEQIFLFPPKNHPPVLNAFNYPYSPMNNLNSTFSWGVQNGGRGLNPVTGIHSIQNLNPFFFNSMSSLNTSQPLVNSPDYTNYLPNPNGLYSHLSQHNLSNLKNHQNNIISGKELKKGEEESALTSLIREILKNLDKGLWIKDAKQPFYYFALPTETATTLQYFIEIKPEEKKNLHIIKMGCNGKKQMGVEIDNLDLCRERLEKIKLLKEQGSLEWTKENEAQLLGLKTIPSKKYNGTQKNPPLSVSILPNKIEDTFEQSLERKPEEKTKLGQINRPSRELATFEIKINNSINDKELKKEGKGEISMDPLLASIPKYLKRGIWLNRKKLIFYFFTLPKNIGEVLEQFLESNPKEKLSLGIRTFNTSFIGGRTIYEIEINTNLELLETKFKIDGKPESPKDFPEDSLSSTIYNLHAAMRCKCYDLVQKLWAENSTLLENWYCGKIKINHPEDGYSLTFSFSILNETFKAAFQAQDAFIIKKLLEINPLLKSWYGGKKVNTATEEAKREECISFFELKTIFESSLRTQREFIIKELWEINPLLKHWYGGGETNIAKTGEAENKKKITPAELNAVFDCTIKRKLTFITEELLRLNPELKKDSPISLKQGGNKRKHIDTECLSSKKRKNNENKKEEEIEAANDKKINLNPTIPIPSFDYSEPEKSYPSQYFFAPEEMAQNKNDLFDEFFDLEESCTQNLSDF